jgi:hypothetical protein
MRRTHSFVSASHNNPPCFIDVLGAFPTCFSIKGALVLQIFPRNFLQSAIV